MGIEIRVVEDKIEHRFRRFIYPLKRTWITIQVSGLLTFAGVILSVILIAIDPFLLDFAKFVAVFSIIAFFCKVLEQK